ncbi:TRAM/LAG1/CLN8-like domain-containing protein [Artemisia annua]|uniref:TRAM/LAG1/CLN8-like domain-containing protein n=1 Tax=Artemisia annua TaxID=35608 RepID=A0A2U1P2D6_ARTAN|nr:TRAM/LAG1/CLN8-like domain-containing protein [Artemisia annua]
MDNSDKVYLVVSGVIFWTSAFLLTRKIFPNSSFDICKRIISTIHAVFAVVLSSISVQDWRYPVSPLASNSSPLQMRALGVNLAYLIYDLVCCWYDKKLKIDNLVHHLVCIVGIGIGLAHERCGTEMVATMWITEISSPSLHLREFLKDLGYKDTNLNLAADVSFAVTYTVARMCFGSYLCFVSLFSSNPILVKAMGVGLFIVSTYWFCNIVRMVKYKLAKLKDPHSAS